MGDAGELWQRMNPSLKIEKDDGNVKWRSAVENSVAVPPKVKSRITT